MPRFYFNFVDGQETIDDPEGIELPDEAAARKQAMDAVLDAQKTRFALAKSWVGWSVEVVDERGNRVLLLPISTVQ
jgi:hypothetical protein